MTRIAVFAPHSIEKAPQQLLYLVYGDNETYRREVKFSILTALNHLKNNESLRIRIMTDRPQDYAGWPVDTVVLTTETLQQWQGENGYHHRRKACAMAAGLGLAERTLFADTDTLFLKSPHLLLKKIRPQRYLMDRFEYHWRDVSARQSYLKLGECLQLHGIKLDSDFKLYNSGLCGLTDNDLPLLETSIGYIDEWTQGSFDIHTIEQIALSLAMHGKPVQETRKYVYHYFGEKRFFHAMQAHFFAQHGEEFSPELIQKCREMPRNKPLPMRWRRLLIKWRLRKLNRLHKKIGRDLLYGSELPDTPYHSACRHEWWESACREIGRWEGQQQLLNPDSESWPETLPKPRKIEAQQDILDYLRRQLAPSAN
ncbi:hypothetical protein [Pseudomonas protegens]|uniref:hypothetical protein n=1 Tax=Pseudomonas protegens TaxID=380021 RepID=UPI0024C3CC1F|nr:hypothetical protein [Pseudomonas protegens]MDK1397222.1 hypothetical protein [Pseudomonas protegens]